MANCPFFQPSTLIVRKPVKAALSEGGQQQAEFGRFIADKAGFGRVSRFFHLGTTVEQLLAYA